MLLLIVIGFVGAAASATRHNATTFDEILLPSAGARGFVTGDFSLVVDQPPLLQYVYGLPVFLTRPNYPVEAGRDWTYWYRYAYARAFFWQSGNDAERIAFIARLVAVALGATLIVVTFLFGRAVAGAPAGLLAAALVASLPDVLAHSGVTYNDVPLALVLVLAAWMIDRAIRAPRARNVAAAGLITGVSLGVKFSAIVLGPIGVLLLACEAASRWQDRVWLRHFAIAVPVFLLSAYLALVGVYLGDFTLAEFWVGLDKNIRHANVGHVVPAVLLGSYSANGWWYFFPVAFFLKTSAALHLLMLIGAVGALARHRRGQSFEPDDIAQQSTHREPSASPARDVTTRLMAPMRVPLISGAVFLAFVMAADLNIGFRHALPILPFLCVLIAAGVVSVWSMRNRIVRLVIVGAVAWHVFAPHRFYPFYLSYLSEYAGPQEYSYEVLVDSNLDWGQGLLALRDFMRTEQISRVMLSYFGTALPEGYGIDYVSMPSYYPLPLHGVAEGDTLPRWVAISATNLAGNYLQGDPFAQFRHTRPSAIVGRSIFLFYLEGE